MDLFPHETIRQEQGTLRDAIRSTVESAGQLVVHAPTGLGKTAAALAPAVEYALEHNKVVLFLTSRLTQHKLALETVQLMREKHRVEIPVVDLIGKKHMCLQQHTLQGKEFNDYCKSMREDDLCDYYTNLKQGEQQSHATRTVLVQLGKNGHTPEHIKEQCREHSLCPYEITMLLAKGAAVIITDYSYVFNPRIRDGFFQRLNKELQDCILIVDEGHNLPGRVKELATERITSNTLKRAAREIEQHNDALLPKITKLEHELTALAARVEEEIYMSREELLEIIEAITPIEPFIAQLEAIETIVHEEQKASSCGVLAAFFTAWLNDEDGYTRILHTKQQFFQLTYRCLDPSVITTPVFDDAQSTIVMSGTLTPVQMYAELLGMTGKTLTLQNPFPAANRQNIIVPKTTTKFTSRSPTMFAAIAATCTEIIGTIPGNVAVFVPSYKILQEIEERCETHKRIFTEQPGLTKEEREHLLQNFRASQLTGAVLFGVMGGSFAEGIDLPGNELQGVIVVGLPLGKPDLETKALIEYYDEKFGKGWAYGYTYPAFNRTLQSAGRCIRTETDRGVIVFLDERYAWQNYHACFPKEMDVRVTLLYKEMLQQFFAQQ